MRFKYYHYYIETFQPPIQMFFHLRKDGDDAVSTFLILLASFGTGIIATIVTLCFTLFIFKLSFVGILAWTIPMAVNTAVFAYCFFEADENQWLRFWQFLNEVPPFTYLYAPIVAYFIITWLFR